ncbi:MAG: HIT domain-containing protein [Candidatus Methanolliviera hydrocarbonicum]|uniref:HIT domain-containing protein n=1 Tax=Candidatus Methanolliviera hydrocarbonicum TaxID=2491085 RepID=A0A520KXB9_9EURY|nr:MAG: HIT domain-containing protein [Candidatus Methanolliviera hydrocarbonicum]
MKDKIFAPWRIGYIQATKDEGCILCDLPREERDEENLILHRGKSSFIIMNRYPYNPGHLMIAPYKHVGVIEELDTDEIYEIIDLCKLAIRAIKSCMEPDGFNIGMNLGRIAGAGIDDHIHLHIVPRWSGDTNFMPVLAGTDVIPEALEETYKKLKEALEK